LGIFLTQRTSLFHTACKGLYNKFGGLNDWVAGFIPPLVDGKSPFKCLFLDENAFVFAVCVWKRIGMNGTCG
jgi:hypothetical protein